MSKEAKLLFISLGLFILAIVYMYVSSNYKCNTIEYQNLTGMHQETVCQWNKKPTCWDKYSTEQQAILNCEK
jgi:hypothetical protein